MEQTPVIPVQDTDLFLDAPPPPELVAQATGKPVAPDQAAVAKATTDPVAQTAAPAASAPATPPVLSPHMVELASTMGVPDPGQYGSDAELSRAIRLAHSLRAPAQAAQAEVKPAANEPTDMEVPDFDPTIYDPKIVQMGKVLKAQKAFYEGEIAKMRDGLPQQVATVYQQAQAAERGRRMLTEAITEAGYDPARLQDASIENKIVAMATAMIKSATDLGIEVDRKAMVKQTLPLVLGAPTGAPAKQTAQAPAPANLAAQRAALASQQARDEKGRYAPGSPTHRAVEAEANGSNVRQMLMDMGIDPKAQPPKDDNDTFL